MTRRSVPVRIAGVARRKARQLHADLVDRERSSCYAPNVQLRLAPDGKVSACCVQQGALGDLREERLSEVWAGARRAELQRRLIRDDFSMGCGSCERELALEGRPGSVPAQYDAYGPGGPRHGRPTAWPRRLDFMLSNACNLQCVQCNGEFSSAIRIHREGRPALVDPYGEDFFEDLRAFIPHLEFASFEGGEPFLAPAVFRVLDLIEELNANLPITVCTNGTRWSPRIERAVRTLDMKVDVSIDAMDAATFRSIRVGAELDVVLANFERMASIIHGRGGQIGINHCLMPSNYRDFPALLRYAEAHGAVVTVSVVRAPSWCSIWHLPRPEIEAIVGWFDQQEREGGVSAAAIPRNRPVWEHEVGRLHAWLAADEGDLARARGDAPVEAR